MVGKKANKIPTPWKEGSCLQWYKQIMPFFFRNDKGAKEINKDGRNIKTICFAFEFVNTRKQASKQITTTTTLDQIFIIWGSVAA